jgi:tetratricopeptide (TPR) repeat protein
MLGFLIFSSLVMIAALYALVYTHSLEARLLLIRIGTGHYGTPDYTLFSAGHLIDIANQFLLLIPIIPVLLFLAMRRGKSKAADEIDRFLLTFSLGGLVFLFALEPKLGMARDWDLFALCGLGPLLWFIRMIDFSLDKYRPLLPFVIILSAMMTLPFWITSMRTESAINHYSYLLELDQPRSRTGYTILRDYYYQQDDSLSANNINTLLADTYPAYRLVRKANQLRDAGRYSQALTIADSLHSLDPYAIEVLNLRGMTYSAMGRHNEALRDLQLAAQLGRYDSRILYNLAQVYFVQGKIDTTMVYLRRAQNLDPKSFYVVEALATLYFRQRTYDSAYYYANHMIQIDSSFIAGYSMAGVSALNLGDTVSARDLLTHYLHHAPDSPDKDHIDKIVRRLE